MAVPREGAVTVSPDNQWICACVSGDDDEPVAWAAQGVVERNGYGRALRYLEGVLRLLEFGRAEQWTAEPFVIHLDNLLAYNILTRFRAPWSQQNWRTSRGKPIPGATLVRRVHDLLSAYATVSFRNVSNHCAAQIPQLRRVKEKCKLLQQQTP